MTQRLSRLFLLTLVAGGAVLISACGTVATPEWAAEAQATQVAQLATAEQLTALAPTATFTATVPPTAVPPTATNTPTPLPATATFTPTAVPPTETPAPTEAPAAAVGPTGDAAAGMVVFNQSYTTSAGQWACSLCHSVTENELRLIGPGLWNVAVRAETRVEGQAAYDYIHTSIVAPNDYIVPADAGGPYPPGLMPQNYTEVLTAQELENVIAYLYTLQS